MAKNQDHFQVEVVVRKNPKPEPYLKQLKNGTCKLIYEVTQEQMDAVAKQMCKQRRQETTNELNQQPVD